MSFRRFSFNVAASAAKAEGGGESGGGGEEESDEPPKVEVTTVVEDDSIHSVRCKLFYKKEKDFKEKGLGMLHLKPVAGEQSKTQMVVRAETNLGNILLNILLSDKMQFVQRGNNVQERGSCRLSNSILHYIPCFPGEFQQEIFLQL